MKYLKKALVTNNIDTLVYHFSKELFTCTPPIKVDFEDLNDFITRTEVKSKLIYKIFNKGSVAIHRSSVFFNTHILKVFHKKGMPTIGDCFTEKEYRGRSIYPYMLQYVSEKLFEDNYKEVLILVSPDNKASIKGIEKAGFKKYCHIKTKRWAIFYFKKHITFYS